MVEAAQSSFPDSAFNEVHWDDTEWQELVTQANRTVDETERCQLIQKAQDIEFERGGFIIWGFPNNVDAHADYVKGFATNRVGTPLASYGFHEVWLDK